MGWSLIDKSGNSGLLNPSDRVLNLKSNLLFSTYTCPKVAIIQLAKSMYYLY